MGVEGAVRLDCAACDRYACGSGRPEAAPATCPMRGEFPAFDTLYAEEGVREFAYQAACVEGAGYCRWTRVYEVAELVKRLGYGRVGVGHCRDMRQEALRVARCLERLGVDAVRPPDLGDCSPKEQAAHFEGSGTDLNVIAGMCVGHDTLFIRHSAVPVTSLVVRDVRLHHNPVAALYTRGGYLKAALHRFGAEAGFRALGEAGAEAELHDPGEPGMEAGPSEVGAWGDDRLDHLARAVRDAGAEREVPPCRLEEVMDFARRAGAGHLGVVFCSGFRTEARQLKAVLGTNGFRVSSICCKAGAVPKEVLGLTEAEKVRPGQPEMLCNPLAQAELLDAEEVDLVLLMGQCVGHDAATLGRLRAPAVCLVAKDRVLAHNTLARVYAQVGGIRRPVS